MKKILLLGAIALMGISAGQIMADDGEHHEGGKRPKQLARSLSQAPAVWKTECGSCHMAYPPGLLPASAWKRQMDTLKNHYGSNATLTPEDEKIIRTYLTGAAADGKYATPSQGNKVEAPRITSSGWFIHKHDEISPAVWKRKSIGSAANCQACHAGAAKGDFNEDGVNIPR